MEAVNLMAGDELTFGPAVGASTVSYEVSQDGAVNARIRDAIKHRDELVELLRTRVAAIEHQLAQGEDAARELRSALDSACDDLGIDNLNHHWRRLAHDSESADAS